MEGIKAVDLDWLTPLQTMFWGVLRWGQVWIYRIMNPRPWGADVTTTEVVRSIRSSHRSSTKTCSDTESFPAYHISPRWWEGDVSVTVKRMCLKTYAFIATLGVKLPSFWHCFQCRSWRCNGEKTRWTIVSTIWSCRLDLPISWGQDIFYSLNLLLTRESWILTRSQRWIGLYLILNRLWNDGTSSGRSSGGSSLPPCT